MTDFPNADSMPPDRPHPVAIILFVIFLAFGPLIVWSGLRVIRARHYQSEWEQSSSFSLGPVEMLNSTMHGVDRYDGADAVRLGVGLESFGALLTLWGLCGAWAVFRSFGFALPPAFGLGACFLSIVLQTAGLVCTLPPWRWGSGAGPMLWIVLAMSVAVAVIAMITHWDVRRIIIFAGFLLIPFMLVVAWFSPLSDSRWLAGLVLAVFAVIAYAAPVIKLTTSLRGSKAMISRLPGIPA